MQVRCRYAWTAKNFRYSFEADGKMLTSCGFRNLGYMRWDRQPSTMLPEANYLTERHEPYMVTRSCHLVSANASMDWENALPRL